MSIGIHAQTANHISHKIEESPVLEGYPVQAKLQSRVTTVEAIAILLKETGSFLSEAPLIISSKSS